MTITLKMRNKRMNLTTPLTGAAQTGLTSPTFTLGSDSAPSTNGKQFYVSALGGTQTGVLANNIANPFTLSLFRPAVIKTMPVNITSINGLIGNAPKNVNKLITRKGLSINSVGGYAIMDITTNFNIPVGAPFYDLVSIKSAISAHLGALNQDLDQWFEAIESGSL